uniref:Uncharacterized protein n=1 Tax=Molossus molossus TaxID=27622 RepID=A0A7J8E255_MOLMO|nr:hypothetical protein HJG59_008962 [Molossus molossus]
MEARAVCATEQHRNPKSLKTELKQNFSRATGPGRVGVGACAPGSDSSGKRKMSGCCRDSVLRGSYQQRAFCRRGPAPSLEGSVALGPRGDACFQKERTPTVAGGGGRGGGAQLRLFPFWSQEFASGAVCRQLQTDRWGSKRSAGPRQ